MLRCSGCKMFVLLQKYEKVTDEFIYDAHICVQKEDRELRCTGCEERSVRAHGA